MLMACVNALNRANPISTVMRIFRYIATRDMCQCPQSGKSHFYANRKKRIVQGLYGVNALNRANPISTFLGYLEVVQLMALCQCPQSGKSHFYPALLELAYLAALRTCFCGYFSEYSDN